MIPSLTRTPRAALLLAALGSVWLAMPVAACGCRAYIPREGEARVAQERALVRWDGATEDIVMALSVEGQSREAAWILPVPAQATVTLADARLFDVLEEFTRPEVRVERLRGDGAAGGAAPAGADAVTVLERQSLGPFDVSTLAATDAGALGGWLDANGYQFPDRLADALEPYVEQQWMYVAVRLTPGTADEALTGTLDPLWVTFASDRIIYPMRLSALARDPLPVFLYVLADHRVDAPAVQMVAQGPDVRFAGWIDPQTLPQDSPLAALVPRRMFLTKFAAQIYEPDTIKDDWAFPLAAADEPYRHVEVRYVVDEGLIARWLWLPGFVILVGLVLLLLLPGLQRLGARR